MKRIACYIAYKLYEIIYIMYVCAFNKNGLNSVEFVDYRFLVLFMTVQKIPVQMVMNEKGNKTEAEKPR